MLNIDNLTLNYIENVFHDELKKIIYNSLAILEMFGLKFYEDKYIELIVRDDGISKENKRDSFISYIKKDIINLINEHGIRLDMDVEISLRECNEVAHFLYIFQRLEDYSEISYRLFGEDTSKNILIDLIQELTLLDKPRLMEIIEYVDDNLITSMREFTNDKLVSITGNIDSKRIKYINSFFEFINNSDCLGKFYYNEGYTSVTLEELSNILTINLVNEISKNILSNLPQAALDVLSILIITKDNYDLPLLKFSKYNYLFTNKLEDVTKLHSVMSKMLSDFNLYLEANKQKENIQ